MTRIILSGCLGRMGKKITEIVAEMEDTKIVCGVDLVDGAATYPVYKAFSDIKEDADVVIDFSHPANFEKLHARESQNLSNLQRAYRAL